MDRLVQTAKIVCVIPARGGSKGVPLKNIRLLAGKPLIAHTIEQVVKAQHDIEVYVSTDDLAIADIATQAGSRVIMRPDSLSGDKSTSESALLHALTEIETKGAIDYVVFLQCTSVFRSSTDIDRAINQIIKDESDSLLSVVPSHRFLWQVSDKGAESINYDFKHRPRRQDMEPQYQENGSIYIFRPWVLRQFNNRLGGKIALYQMDERSAIDIDSELDFKVAELLLSQCTENKIAHQ
ncbi:acylneuraminate cytidylyltransferase [Glaciecola sp. 4H-3-7+YE-5]|nr:acylneuraminate cytidylyltransferase [Glaciecola sp. 4H-3-7+YE-5]